MTSFTFLLFFVSILALVLIGLNLLLATHKPYKEKDSSFECGFHSFLGQNRSEFAISFFLFGLLFLIFDLEIVLSFPYVVSGYANASYGLTIIFFFFIFLTAGFCFEIGKKALTINSRQINIHRKFIPQDLDFVKSSQGNKSLWLKPYLVNSRRYFSQSCFLLSRPNYMSQFIKIINMRSFSISHPRLMESDTESNNWSCNQSTASNTSVSIHEDNIYGDKNNNQWFNRRIDFVNIWENDDFQENPLRSGTYSQFCAEGWGPHCTRPLISLHEPTVNELVEEFNSIILNINEEIKHHADEIIKLNWEISQSNDVDIEIENKIQFHQNKIKEITGLQVELHNVHEVWHDLALTARYPRQGYLQEKHAKLTESIINPRIQEIIRNRTNKSPNSLRALADGLLIAGYISFTVGGVLLALLLQVDIFSPAYVN